VDDGSDRPLGGPLAGYLRRGFRESPRGLGVLTAGVGIAAVGALAHALDVFIAGLAVATIMLAIDLVSAVLERRADEKAGRAFSKSRPPAEEGPSTTANEDLDALRARREHIETELDDLRHNGAP